MNTKWFMPCGWPSVMAAIEVLAWGPGLTTAFAVMALWYRRAD